MASAEDILEVRANTDESDDTNGFTDDIIGDLIDADDVLGASTTVWERKAAKYASLVNTTEAGASHAFSDLHKNALAMAALWGKKDAAADEGTPAGRPRVHKIVRD